MNFYKHHLGDYAKDTAHLSLLEHGAYRRMIDVYYASEKPLPVDEGRIFRLVGARSREEREAVQVILSEFFQLQQDGWHNKRCDEELGKYGAQAETNRRIAAEREARKRERIVTDDETNRLTNRDPADNESLHEPSHESLHESLNEHSTLTSAEREPSHKPLAISQEKPTPPQPPSAIAKGGDTGTNGHDLLGQKPARPKRSPKLAMPQGWSPKPTTLDWVNDYLAEHDLSEDWAQRQHDLFIGKAKANAWVYADWDQAYQNFFRENGPGGRYYRAEARAA